MQRKTKYLVYVDEEIMEQADDLIDAVMAHFVKIGLDTRIRKQFLAESGKATLIANERALEVINGWVQVRDIKSFPFRKKEEEKAERVSEEKNESTEVRDEGAEDDETKGD